MRAFLAFLIVAATMGMAHAQTPGPRPERVPPPPPPPREALDFAQGRAEFQRGNLGPAYLLLLPHAQRGNPEAQFLVGSISDTGGGGIDLDPREAARWYRQAAQRDWPAAHWRLAKAYATARGVEGSADRALDHLMRAAELGFTPAILDLAGLLDDGRGVVRDREKAFVWYMRAGDLGNTEARFTVGERLFRGDGVEEDREEARRWYTLAAQRGHPGAMFRLAQIGFGRDQGVDYRINAYFQLTMAIQRGGPDVKREAQELRDRLTRNMIDTDVAAAMQRVRNWKPSPPAPGEPVDPEDPYNKPEGR
ncbi:MAG: sel1 repeat family protein [Azospirillum sp.]|nr:sel1 repeat family protein [Azospirillum sp.]MCA3264989.1 sel1 repeat family protein [Azospirillum sp.]MCZ8124042.1 tetratricopeptide repeat protein [Magnetospirillum sp.]